MNTYCLLTLVLVLVIGMIVAQAAERDSVKDPAQVEFFIAPLRGADFKAAAARLVDGMLPQAMPAAMREEIRGTMLSAPQHITVGAMEAMFGNAAIWEPHPIRVPLQLLLAANPAWSVDYERFVRQLAPQVDYRVFTGVSHFLMMERQEPVNRAIQEFLTSNLLLGFK